jgi:hypothetical protein
VISVRCFYQLEATIQEGQAMLQIPKALHSNFDYRYNLNQLEDLDLSSDFKAIIKTQAQSVACLVHEHFLKKREGGWQFGDDVPTLAQQQEQNPEFQNVQFGEYESFQNEYAAGFGTAFLVGKGLALTAAHCICIENSNELNTKLINATRSIIPVLFETLENDNYKVRENATEALKKYDLTSYLKSYPCILDPTQDLLTSTPLSSLITYYKEDQSQPSLYSAAIAKKCIDENLPFFQIENALCCVEQNKLYTFDCPKSGSLTIQIEKRILEYPKFVFTQSSTQKHNLSS